MDYLTVIISTYYRAREHYFNTGAVATYIIIGYACSR